MTTANILIFESSHSEQDAIIDVLTEHFNDKVTLTLVDNIEDAKKLCSANVFNLIIMDLYCPEKLIGESFIHWVKSFYSINQQTKILVLTKEVHEVADLAQSYNLHPEAKSDHYKKILAPIQDLLALSQES